MMFNAGPEIVAYSGDLYVNLVALGVERELRGKSRGELEAIVESYKSASLGHKILRTVLRADYLDEHFRYQFAKQYLEQEDKLQ